MAVTAAELGAFREAARISAKARDWAASQVRPGVLLRTVQEGAEELIRSEGALPSFPAQTSRNVVAAHYCSSPSDPTRFEPGDLVKVDVGAHVDGYPADTGVSVDLSPDGRWGPLIDAASAALDAAIALLRDRVRVGEIGAVVEKAIVSRGFRPIANLSGHGLARWSLHAPPQIPNIRMPGGEQLRAGTVFAIEPFSTTGPGFVTDRGAAEVFSQLEGHRDDAGQSEELRSLLEQLESWNRLPVARRYFTGLTSEALDRCLGVLAAAGTIHAYRPLAEGGGGMVAWKEHTIYLSRQGPEILTS